MGLLEKYSEYCKEKDIVNYLNIKTFAELDELNLIIHKFICELDNIDEDDWEDGCAKMFGNELADTRLLYDLLNRISDID